MQFDHSSFPEGSAPSSQAAGGAAPHPASQPHPHPSSAPHPQPVHTHHPHHPHPHYPYPSRFGGSSYSFFSWPRVGLWGSTAGGYNPSFAAPPAFSGTVPPPPSGLHPAYHSPWSSPADQPAWHRSCRRGPRFLPFLLLAGGGFYAYKKLKHEISDVKAAVAASDEQAAAALKQREGERCGRRHHGWGGWREEEGKWAEWQALVAQQRAKTQQQALPVEGPKQEEKPASGRWI